MLRILTYLVLLIHINTTMFFPVVEETIHYDKKGRAVDDVTSIAEFVSQVLLQQKDATPKDEEEDERYSFFHSMKTTYCITPQKIMAPQAAPFIPVPDDRSYPMFQDIGFPVMSYDIIIPPPKA